MTKRAKTPLLLAVGVLAVALWAAAPDARADFIFEVNNAGDRSDADPGDDSCDVAPGAAGEQCSLRAAIEETNAVPGGDAIRFAIPGPGVHKITPDTALPVISDPVEINGYSQPGASPNTNDLGHLDNAELRIELSGEDQSSDAKTKSWGLQMVSGADGTVIKGLVINRWLGGVLVNVPMGIAKVQGNFIGTNPSGTLARGNVLEGVTSGGATPNTVAIVGGPDPADRNVISANGGGVIGLYGGVSVHGNFIGTQADGSSPLGNSGDGVRLNQEANSIGGASGGANVIAFNGGDGITLVGNDSGSNWFSRNRIFGNGDLGIDLGDDGITPNDPLDADAGQNGLQNFPVLIRAVTGPKATTVQASLDGTPNDTFIIEFFASPKGIGRQGKRFIGQRVVKAAADGNVRFGFRPAHRVPVGDRITATATDSGYSTSEFSAPRAVTRP